MDGARLTLELTSFKVIYDTREHPGAKLDERLKAMGCPCIRKKLNFGDYSAKTDNCSLEDSVVIERKMGLDELTMCLGSQRARFEREFERAAAAGAKIYLLIENCTIDTLYNEDSYRMRCHSKMSRSALVGSLYAWCARYGMVPIFCADRNSGPIIRDILQKELRERLINEQE